MGAFSLCYFVVDTFVLAKMLHWFHAPVPFRELLPVRASTYVVSLVNTQLGQGALALYVHRRFGTPLGEIAGTVAVLALLEVSQLVGFASLGIAAFPGAVPRGLFSVPPLVALVWSALWLLARRPRGAGIAGRIAASALFDTLRRARPRQLAAILALKAAVFLLSLAVHGFALGLFGVHVPWIRLLAFLPIVFLVAALPVTVAHLGTSQAAWIFFFGAVAPEANLLAYSLASHLTFMLANSALGLVFLPRAYRDLVR